MAAFTESCFKNSIMVALTLVLLGMCCKTVKIFLDGGTVREVTIKVRDRLPGPSVTICPLSEKGVLKEDFLDWEEYPKNIMDAYRITIIDMYVWI